MKNRGYKIFKIVALVLAIIIPLTVAFLMCRYTYKRHLPTYENTYFANIKYDRKGNDKENYKEQLEGYLTYSKDKFRLFDTKEIKYDEDKTLGTLDIYQVVERAENASGDGYTYELYYYFILHNVNHAALYYLHEGDSNATFTEDNAATTTYMQIRNAGAFDTDSESTNYEFNTEDFLTFVFVDYGANPSKVGKQYIYSLRIKSTDLPSNNITLAIHCDDEKSSGHGEAPDDDKTRYVYDATNSLNVDNFYIDLTDEELASFTSGYNGDALASGYNKYLLKTYWWWEALVTIVLIGALTGIFYMVLTYQGSDEKE
ncbi:MAG: hypothetical protein J6W25_02275 [Bacilli bacterium]|nr:hypothetical protein [Bacilli bacterium]